MRTYLYPLVILGILSSLLISTSGGGEGLGKLKGTIDRSHVHINIIVVPWSEIRALCKKEVNKNGPGCARWYEKKNECWIWIPEPIGLGDGTAFKIAGHELWHCKIGDFHK